MTAGSAPPEKQRSRFYWFRRNLGLRTAAFVKEHKFLFIVLAVSALVLLFFLRAFVHPLVLAARVHVYVLTLGLPLAGMLWVIGRRLGWKGRMALVAGLALALTAMVAGGVQPHRYIALYLRHRSLKIVELKTLPLTDHERIQPQNSIVALANEAMNETETPADPHFVRVGGEYRWTIGIEPSYLIRRLTRGVLQVFSIPGTAPSPSFAGANRIPVHFPTGENLLLWHRTDLNVIRAFGPWRYLNYEPGEVKYVTDDHGRWVQVVSLIRWRGWFFPRPEFGGVQVVEQEERGGVAALARHALAGVGRWIPPGEIQKYPFLRGQSLVPRAVSRFIAHSFRFQAGFLAPFPGYHLGDIRIPDMPGDVYDQPFTLYFRPADGGVADGLYHYFGLEPFQAEKQGLNMSLFIPADGTSVVYAYSHAKRSEALTGVSAISAKVMETRKQYDWSRNRPVEHRPFIRTIAGKTRFFWLTTVVTLKGEKGEKSAAAPADSESFIAGTTPEVALTDAAYRTVVWVDPMKPEQWTHQLEKELRAVWKD